MFPKYYFGNIVPETIFRETSHDTLQIRLPKQRYKITKMVRKQAAVCGAIIISLILKRRKKRRKNRKVWVKPWLKTRRTCGAYHNLMQELRLTDVDGYRNFIRMDVDTFNNLLNLAEPFITRTATRFRSPIPAGERLVLTLHFLATGKASNITSTRLHLAILQFSSQDVL